MTFIINADANPSDFSIPKFNLGGVDFESIITSGSLVLAKPANLLSFAGKNIADFSVSENLAKAMFQETYNTTEDASLWISNNTDKTANSYITMSAEKGGLRLSCNRTATTPVAAIIGTIKFISTGNMLKVLSTDKNIYLDAWIEPINLPVAILNTTKPWGEVASVKIGESLSPSANSGQRITANYVNLQVSQTDQKWYQKPSDSSQEVSQLFRPSSYVLNSPNFVCTAGKLNANSVSMQGSISASILEGGYMAQDFIIYSLYAEDLTVSGRTADEVATIRKSHFDKFFD